MILKLNSQPYHVQSVSRHFFLTLPLPLLCHPLRKLPDTRRCQEVPRKIAVGKVPGNLHKLVCSLVKFCTLFTKGKFSTLIYTRETLIAGALHVVGTHAEKVLL